MVKIEILLYNDDDSFKIIESKEFPKAETKWDNEVEDWVYKTVLSYDIKYDFADWENAPDYYIKYIENTGKTYKESMVEYVMGL